MNIRSKLMVSTGVTVIVALAIGVELMVLDQDDKRQRDRIAVFQAVAQEVQRLNNLTFDYMFHNSSRALTQWNMVYEGLTAALQAAIVDSEEERIIMSNLNDDHGEIRLLFDRLVGLGHVPQAQGREILADQLLLKTQEMISGSMELAHIGDQHLLTMRRNSSAAIVILILGLSLVLVITGMRLFRGIMSPLQRLIDGAEKVGGGDLEYRIGLKTNDELGEVAQRFDIMTERLAQGRALRMEAEKELRTASIYARSLLEASLDPLVTISAEGKILDVNHATEEATGLPRGQLVGTDFANYFTESDLARAGYRQVLEKGLVRDYALTLRHATGQTTDVLYNASLFKDEAGNVQGVFAAARDVTELKRAEREVRQLNAELEQRVVARTAELEDANHELEAFAYSVSHDLRTPLRAIDGFSLILLEDYEKNLDDEGKRLLNVVRDNTVKMAQLIDDILQFSRTGRREMVLAEVDMERLVHEVVEELKPVYEGRDVRIEIQSLSTVNGDRSMLYQAVTNLIGNAVKFTRKKEAAVIEMGSKREGDEQIFFVKDNGAGFDMRYVEKLFGVFQRLHTAEEFEGTGIGLAIVKRVVTRHGGRVWAESKLNEGATFYFALPAKEESHG